MSERRNPYTLLFGKEPEQRIPRTVQASQIIESFCDEKPSQQIFMITGVRGCGKTVFMTDVSKKIASRSEWIVTELNPEKDLLESLLAKLYDHRKLAGVFKAAKINLSLFGIGVEIEGVPPISDIETALSRMLHVLQKQGKRVLVTIDEVSNTKEMRVFASAFQIFIRQDLPLFLMMTGLFENISELQNEKTLTFLYRAPKIEMKPLNIGTVSANYKNTFHLPDEQALEMAKLTKGYSFAFQVLGYFVWEHNGNLDDAMTEVRQYLDEYVYEKIWSELSRGDRRIAYGIANTSTGKISEIRTFLQMETNQFNPYRKRLIRKGLLNGDERGYVRFTLPMFEKFVLENFDE